jgi:hypothetical protein
MGDEIRAHMRWAGRDLASLMGEEISLRFFLNRATLYAYCFGAGD